MLRQDFTIGESVEAKESTLQDLNSTRKEVGFKSKSDNNCIKEKEMEVSFMREEQQIIPISEAKEPGLKQTHIQSPVQEGLRGKLKEMWADLI